MRPIEAPQFLSMRLSYTGCSRLHSGRIMNRKKLLPTFAWICLFVLGSAAVFWLVDSVLAAFP
jgi:hypothetical protein